MGRADHVAYELLQMTLLQRVIHSRGSIKARVVPAHLLLLLLLLAPAAVTASGTSSTAASCTIVAPGGSHHGPLG